MIVRTSCQPEWGALCKNWRSQGVCCSFARRIPNPLALFCVSMTLKTGRSLAAAAAGIDPTSEPAPHALVRGRRYRQQIKAEAVPAQFQIQIWIQQTCVEAILRPHIRPILQSRGADGLDLRLGSLNGGGVTLLDSEQRRSCGLPVVRQLLEGRGTCGAAASRRLPTGPCARQSPERGCGDRSHGSWYQAHSCGGWPPACQRSKTIH